jgi:hypothetical protein
LENGAKEVKPFFTPPLPKQKSRMEQQNYEFAKKGELRPSKEKENLCLNYQTP